MKIRRSLMNSTVKLVAHSQQSVSNAAGWTTVKNVCG